MDKKKNEVIKTLNELVRIFKERDTVRKILQAKDVKAVYEEEKAAMSEQLESFNNEMQPFIDEGEEPISDVSEVISSENVVEICFILLMSGVDDEDLVDDIGDIEFTLGQVQGERQEIANRLSDFLYKGMEYFSDYTEEEVLKKLLL